MSKKHIIQNDENGLSYILSGISFSQFGLSVYKRLDIMGLNSVSVAHMIIIRLYTAAVQQGFIGPRKK